MHPVCRPLNKHVILNLNLSSQRLKSVLLNVKGRRKRLFLFEKSFIFNSVLFPVCVCKTTLMRHSRMSTKAKL